MKFQRISPDQRQAWQPQIVAIEQTTRYPLGDDWFEIDHGDDYFAFFDRLGDIDYYIGLAPQPGLEQQSQQPLEQQSEQLQVAIVGAGILRQVPFQQGAAPQAAWYLCDLKVHPQHQGKRGSLGILRYAVAQGIGRADRGYLISMNPGDGSPNRLVRVLERWPLVSLKQVETLNIYSVDASQMQRLEPLLNRHRGPICYQSLDGIKDLRLQSTGEVLPLLHVQWAAPSAAGSARNHTATGFAHMFCAPSQDALAIELNKIGLQPTATASIVAHGMKDCDWRFVLTSDI
jgi:hypothetical protein